MSDSTIVEPSRRMVITQAKIRQVLKQKRRKRVLNFKKRIKVSKRWQKLSKPAIALQHKVANQTQNWLHE
ncbi:hypothetical protein [Pantanalinema sp. GBBB05]|uniref:hypothetical protein n=1 Tax=Pantanalinema sp. GBBB05 TaxID=2604139 RepID=UPI001D302ECB|nr:hypothetical protein [Pantanalinema sp. GBBB05]